MLIFLFHTYNSDLNLNRSAFQQLIFVFKGSFIIIKLLEKKKHYIYDWTKLKDGKRKLFVKEIWKFGKNDINLWRITLKREKKI